jgi:hypothetical protein
MQIIRGQEPGIAPGSYNPMLSNEIFYETAYSHHIRRLQIS